MTCQAPLPALAERAESGLNRRWSYYSRTRTGDLLGAIYAWQRESHRRFQPRRRLRRRRHGGERSFRPCLTPPPSMRECGCRESWPPKPDPTLLDASLATLTETLRPLRASVNWPGSRTGLDLAPLIVHRHPNHLADRWRLHSYLTLEQRLQRAGLDRGDPRIALFAQLFQEIQENYWFGARPASNVIACVPAPLVMPPLPLSVHEYVAPGWLGTDAVNPLAPWTAVEGAVMLASGAIGGGGVVTWSEKSSMKKLV